MKNITLLLAIAGLVSSAGLISSCDSSSEEHENAAVITAEQPTEQTAASFTEEPESEAAARVEPPTEQTAADFWRTFQTAVAASDVETIESLYVENPLNVNRFSNEEYKAKIADAGADAIRLTGERYQDKPVYEYQMVLGTEGEDSDGSTTTVFMIRNDEGQLRIFNVLEAG